MSHLPNSQIALKLGKHVDFFTHVKRNSPKLYRLMRIYGRGCLYTGAKAYFEAIGRMRMDLAQMYYELDTCTCFYRFFMETEEDNPYKNVQSFVSTLETSAFNTTERTGRFDGYVSGKRLLRVYEEWKKTGYTKEEQRYIREMHA